MRAAYGAGSTAGAPVEPSSVLDLIESRPGMVEIGVLRRVHMRPHQCRDIDTRRAIAETEIALPAVSHPDLQLAVNEKTFLLLVELEIIREIKRRKNCGLRPLEVYL